MDLPDCPPGAEGYQDSFTEVPRKPDEKPCTKAEQEFQEHLNSLKIKLDDGTTRPMVERRGRDIAGKWIYLCYPCAAVCAGESVLQSHISGKKHKSKLAVTNIWPKSIFDEHPYHNNVQTKNSEFAGHQEVMQKMAEEVERHNSTNNELDKLFGMYRNATCHLQESIDGVKAPLVGLEYLIEFPPEQVHYEPKYICTLCSKQGHPRTIINHMTCFWHRYNYILRHYPKACNLLTPYRSQQKYREGVGVIINRLAARIEDKYGRKRPVNIDKEEYDKDKDRINQWIFKGDHFAETEGTTFEEVVDVGLLDSLNTEKENSKEHHHTRKEPSPPVVAAPAKPRFNNFSRPAGRQERRTNSMESLSDISDDMDNTDVRKNTRPEPARDRPDDRRHGVSPSFRSRYAIKNIGPQDSRSKPQDKTRPANYEYKQKLATDKRTAAEESAKKTLSYHEKNPEKHPLYPEEWKKFWNKRYKEIQAEGKDPSKHDFKPEWITYWTARMKVLHDEELRITINEIYRKLTLSPPDMTRKESPPPTRAPPRKEKDDKRRRSPEHRRRSIEPRRRSPEPRRRSPEPRRRSPEARYRSPDPHHRSDRRRSPDGRHRSPLRRRSPDYRRDRRSPPRRSPARPVPTHALERQRSPPHRQTRSRSPLRRSPARTRIALESLESLGRSRSPLSQREMQSRNRSPDLAPSLQTVLISDDELRPDDGLSPWNSDNEIGSVASQSPSRSHAGSHVSRSSRAQGRSRKTTINETTAPDDVVATLRLLVALEDYLGSLGPKLIDLLGEALKMEKNKPNSSEELLVRDSAVVLLETAKEKLKGAAQAGLLAGSAAAAARAAVVRAAATLHEADKRMRAKQQQLVKESSSSSTSAVPVAGVGEVDRAQIAQQMAEALIAQGKTDVSSEELAQLVDAVVGMAEAKKREAERRQPEIRPAPLQKPLPVVPKPSGTASALQMLQSAYDENDKKVEKEEAPDAMDGLSDSDLETLLKNFNELSAEEQHSLIAYLKKLEAREPARVERLRQYVSDAAHAPAPAPAAPAARPRPPRLRPSPSPEVQPMVLESDDDDYTVEEVFNTAKQKVKEDQIRQEMEIVKKSLEETKPATPPAVLAPAEAPANISSIVDITRSLSSASDLFALVQASLKSTAVLNPAPMVDLEVVISNTQPRSFGDLPEAPAALQEPATPVTPALPTSAPEPLIRNASEMDIDHLNDFENSKSPDERFGLQNPTLDERFGSGDNLSQGNPTSNERSSQGNQYSNERFGQGNPTPIDRFGQGNPPSNDRFGQGNQNPNERFGPGNQGPNDRFGQGNQPTDNRFGQGNGPQGDRFGQGNLPPSGRPSGPGNQQAFGQGNSPNFGQGNQGPNDRFGPGNQGPNDRFGPGKQGPNDRFGPGNQGPNERFGPGNQGANERFGPGNQGPNERFGPGNQGPNERFVPGNQGPNERFVPGNQGPNDRFGPGNQGPNERFVPGNQGPNERFVPGNQGPNDRFGPGNQGPNERFATGNPGPNDRFGQSNEQPLGQVNPPPNDRFGSGNLNNQWNQRPNNVPLGASPPMRGGLNNPPRFGGPDNFGPGGPYNQGPRPNFFMNGRGDNRQNMNPQFGNFEHNNFRGRGRGGPMRGRGRGYY